MADYINREAALAQCKRHDDYTAWSISEGIEALQAADVEPVRHGRWADNGIPDSMLSGCSACGFSCGASSFRYCPNCGAKMDGGVNNG